MPAWLTRARAFAVAAEALLIAFIVCIALATVGEVHHNQAVGPHRGAPHDRPVHAR